MVPAKASNRQSFIHYLIESKGGSDFLLDTLESVSNFAGNFWKRNKKYQSIMKTLKYSFPAYFLSKELYDTYKLYKENARETDNDAYSNKLVNILYFLGMEEQEALRDCDEGVHQKPFNLGADVVNWVFTSPKTSLFKIKGFYEIEGRKKMHDMFSLERGCILIPIEFKDSTFVWEFNFTRFESDISVHESQMHCFYKDSRKADLLRGVFFKEFMKHFDIKNNVLCMRNSGYSSRPRIEKPEAINQFDIESLAEEILKVLQRGLKRGYVFVGIPGVGKSTIIRALESVKKLLDYPFVYLDETCWSYENTIKDTFKNLRSIEKFIAVMEDADSLGFGVKNSRLGTFLNEIDGVNKDLSGVFIMTINDTSLVHYTAINRPGRFDEVILIEPPRTNEEVYEVLKTQYNKRAANGEYLKGKPFININVINEKLLEQIHKKGYAQADICEIVEKALLIEQGISNESLYKSFLNLGKSKEAIRACNFKDLEPSREYDGSPIEAVGVFDAVESVEDEVYTANKNCMKSFGA